MNEHYYELSEEEYDEEEYDQELMDEEHFPEEEYNSTLADPSGLTSAHYIRKAEDALNAVKNVVEKSGWKKIHTHKSGVVVYSKQGESEDNKTPFFMGQHDIQGFPPQSVFSVIGMRRLWDELYEEGNLVENLDDTTSLTYMVMRGMAGSKTRDFSLVEKVDCSPDGIIFFVSTSVITPKIPHHVGKIRANVKLNGWILEPISEHPPVTRVTYVLQSDVRGWIPSVFAKKYLARRPLVLHTIKTYLQKNGSPVMIYSPTNSRRSSYVSSHYTTENPMANENDDATMGTKVKRQKILFRDDNLIDPPKVSSVQMTREARVAPEYTRDIVYSDDNDSPRQSQTASVKEHSTSEHLISEHSISEHPISENSISEHPISEHSISEHPISENSISEHSISEHSSETPPASPVASNDSIEEVIEIPEPEEQMIVHRHTELVQNALKNLKSLYGNLNDWVLYTENKGARVYTMDSGRPLPIMRGDITYTGYTPDDILSVVSNVGFRKLWDDRFEEGSTYERWSMFDTLTRSAMKGTFPVSGRDLALINTADRDPVTGIIWFVSTSVVDPVIPLSKKYVRAELRIAGWVLKPNKDESGTVQTVDASYIVDIDIKLDSIPSSILKSISMQTPTCVIKINETIHKYGFPPYLKRLTGELEHEGFNEKTFQCEFTLKFDGGNIAEIQMSKAMYPNGFDVSFNGNVQIESIHDNRELIRLIMPTGTSSHKINVKITKNTFRDIRRTYNRSQSIPIALPESVTTIKSPTPEVKGVKLSSSQVKKTRRDVVYFPRPVEKPTMVPVTKAIDTKSNESATSTTPTDDHVSLTDRSFIQQPSIPPDDHVSLTDRSSIQQPSIPPDDHVSLTDRHSIQQPSISPEKTVTSSEILQNPEETHQLSASEPISRNKSEDGIPTPKTLMISKRISFSDFVKNFRWGSQKVGLIVASMVLAYYAGKMSDCCAL